MLKLKKDMLYTWDNCGCKLSVQNQHLLQEWLFQAYLFSSVSMYSFFLRLLSWAEIWVE